MHRSVTRLFPAPSEELPIEGLYLGHDLHARGLPGRPFTYSNFITSLDGRIAIATEERATHIVPPAIANPRDWRLYQELAGQADLLITSGRYFRQSLLGEAQDELPLGSGSAYDDIRNWRSQHGLAPQPDIVIMSSSLNIPVAALERYRSRTIYVMTGDEADPSRVASLRNHGIEVIPAGPGHSVDGRRMYAELAARNYRSIYAIAGPAVFHTLAAAGIVDRLYLTITLQILGGQGYDTLTRGGLLEPVPGMHLAGLYHDPHAPVKASQLFGIFEPLSRTSPPPPGR